MLNHTFVHVVYLCWLILAATAEDQGDLSEQSGVYLTVFVFLYKVMLEEIEAGFVQGNSRHLVT